MCSISSIQVLSTLFSLSLLYSFFYYFFLSFCSSFSKSSLASKGKSEPLAISLETAFQGHMLEKLPTQTVHTTGPQLLAHFTEMWRIRRMEMAADALYKAKLIRGFCHLGIGQVPKVVSRMIRALSFCY
jgi:hypothetical protein